MTMKKSGIWIGAGLASVVMHAGAILGLGWIVTPEAVKNQPLPQSQISIQAQNVDRVTAREDTIVSETLDEENPQATPAAQVIVPQSNAKAMPAPSAIAFPTSLEPERLSSAKPAETTALAGPAPAQAIAAVAAVSKPTTALIAQVQTTSAIAARTQAIAAVAVVSKPTTALIAQVQTTSATAAPTQASATLALPTTMAVQSSIADQASRAPAQPLLAVAGKAALAWSGSEDDTIEFTSLANIQAFMQPGDIDLSDSNLGEVRDGISAILASVPCSRLHTTFIPETGQLELRGHVPEDALRGPILAALQEQVGDAIPISDQLLILPRPQCGALSGIADVGLPQSTEQLTNPRVIGADGFAQNYTYFDGQRLQLDLVAPDYDSFVYVDYFTADGNVIHLQPNSIVPLEFAPAKSPLSVGKNRGDKPALDIKISPPFGHEIAAAFASSIPLYEGLRPLQESAEPYLNFLQEQVAIARGKNPSFKGEWVYFFISTKKN